MQNSFWKKPAITVDSRYLDVQEISETLRDIHTSTYLICGIGENNQSNNNI